MTIDLTTITTPFGLLDDEAQAQLRAAKDAGLWIELFCDAGWVFTPEPAFRKTTTYRLAPGQVWPKPEPKRGVQYVFLLENGNVCSCHKPIGDFIWGQRILARTRVELVEGQFDE